MRTEIQVIQRLSDASADASDVQLENCLYVLYVLLVVIV